MTELTKIVGEEKIRYDWYQTEQMVVLNVLKRNIDESKLLLEYANGNLSITLPNVSEPFVLQLSHEINGPAISKKVTSSKLEVRLPKLETIQWKVLEGEDVPLGKPITVVSGDSNQSSSSNKPNKNWDALVKGEEVDDGDALSELFKKIYNEGSDEVRKAMNKSFLESNGTVLSTNWGEVGTDKVEAKPPEGLEWKKWN